MARTYPIRRLQHIRLFCNTTRRCNRVAPPDPISHMRPIIYDDAPGPSTPMLLQHPYSLTEFKDATSLKNDYELQFKLQRQQLDSFHHHFWLDTNTRRNAAMETILSSLPETATQRDREDAVSEFNGHWIAQEKSRTDEYTTEWRKRNFSLIKLAARVEMQKLATRISEIFRSTS